MRCGAPKAKGVAKEDLAGNRRCVRWSRKAFCFVSLPASPLPPQPHCWFALCFASWGFFMVLGQKKVGVGAGIRNIWVACLLTSESFRTQTLMCRASDRVGWHHVKRRVALQEGRGARRGQSTSNYGLVGRSCRTGMYSTSAVPMLRWRRTCELRPSQARWMLSPKQS